MEAPEPHPAESRRMASLRRLQLLDSPAEQMWDHVTQLAARICNVPVALMTVVDVDRQWFKSRVGLEVSETSRDESFCGHAILEHETFTVPDAAMDPRFSSNPLVIGNPMIRFYAGRPVRMPDGLPIGTLCVIDRKPRELTVDQHEALTLLALQAEELLRLREIAVEMQIAVADPSDAQEVANTFSHEIATPLGPIMNRMKLLRHEVSTEAGQLHLTAIENSIAKLVETLRRGSKSILGSDSN